MRLRYRPGKQLWNRTDQRFSNGLRLWTSYCGTDSASQRQRHIQPLVALPSNSSKCSRTTWLYQVLANFRDRYKTVAANRPFSSISYKTLCYGRLLVLLRRPFCNDRERSRHWMHPTKSPMCACALTALRASCSRILREPRRSIRPAIGQWIVTWLDMFLIWNRDFQEGFPKIAGRKHPRGRNLLPDKYTHTRA